MTSMAEEEKTQKLGNSQSLQHYSFTWNFDTVESDQIQSDVFEARGHKWRIFCSKEKSMRNVMIYIKPADNSETLPDRFTINADCTLSVIKIKEKLTIVEEAKNTFNGSDVFTLLVSLGLGRPLWKAFADNEEYQTVNNDAFIVRAKVWCDEEQEKGEPDFLINQVKIPSSLAEIDKEIVNAQTILKQGWDMDMESFVRSGRALELKKSLSIMLATNSFPSPNWVDKTIEFLSEFDSYEAAKRELREAQESDELARNEAEAVNREVKRLESVLDECEAKKARISKRLEDLAGQETALISAQQNMEMISVISKGQEIP